MELFQCTPNEWAKEEEKWLKCLEDEAVWNSIPYVNSNDFSYFPNCSLVKFRGMVQDMHGPEFYVEEFERTNKNTGEKSYITGKYIDSHQYEDYEEVITHPNNKTGERHLFMVISIPALNSWVNNIENERSKLSFKLPSTNTASKRSLDEQMENCSLLTSPNQRQCTTTSSSTKVTTSGNNTTSENKFLNNFPIADRSNKRCFMLIYGNTDKIVLNGIYDFIGFLTTNSNSEMENTEDNSSVLIPRIHCVQFKNIQHCNPLIDHKLVQVSDQLGAIKNELLIVLTNILLGDSLAAEYLIFNLISKIYLRKDLLVLGKFALNISNIPNFDSLDYGQELYKFIELLTTKSLYLPMTLKNMNELQFTAKKDYASSCLISSVLQLSSSTHLVLDESKLTTGQLNDNGVRGIKTLISAIQTQKINYDFTYYQIEFDCDIPILILSEGKSLLSSDCHVILQPDEMHLNTFKEITEAARHFLKPELLNQIRAYLTAIKLLEYEIEESMEDLIQKEYVEMRQKGSGSSDDLHSLLILARLVCLSEGKSVLDEASWKRACYLETSRKERLKKVLKK